MFSRRHTTLSRETCSLQPNAEDTMEDFRLETMKALWQAFHALDTAESGLVHVSQLKVITSNVGMKLGVDKAEELLNKDGVKSMDFNSYFDIIKAELIDQLDTNEQNGKKPLSERLNSVIKSCWMFCNFERLHKSKWLSSDHCLVLWRLFNFLTEADNSGEPVLPVQLHSEEAGMILKKFVDVTGQMNKEQVITDSLSEIKSEGLTFTDFLNVFEKDCITNLSKGDITHGVNNLQDTYLLNILGKGMLWKRGFKVKIWKERWFVMTPKELRYYVTSNEKVLKGVIEFDSECKVEVLPDRLTNKQNRFVIQTKKKPYEISAPDMKTKNEWVSGVQMALDHVGKDTHIQKEAARGRCKARMERKRTLEEEERRRREEAEFLRQQQGELDEEKRKRLEDEELLRKRLAELEEERKKREEAEARFLEERALKEAEQQRLRELEEIRRELERLLEEERQAKKDEEIVRNLQARLLEEEFERREELERLKQQQEDMLKAEREQKAMLESDRQDQEARLKDAQNRLLELETERAQAAQKMQEATEKLQKAEKDRHIMEEKVKLWKTPVGLARPIQPTANPFVTHRGQGAFCEQDFATQTKSLSNSQKDAEQEKPETEHTVGEKSDKKMDDDNADIDKNTDDNFQNNIDTGSESVKHVKDGLQKEETENNHLNTEEIINKHVSEDSTVIKISTETEKSENETQCENNEAQTEVTDAVTAIAETATEEENNSESENNFEPKSEEEIDSAGSETCEHKVTDNENTSEKTDASDPSNDVDITMEEDNEDRNATEKSVETDCSVSENSVEEKERSVFNETEEETNGHTGEAKKMEDSTDMNDNKFDHMDRTDMEGTEN